MRRSLKIIAYALLVYSGPAWAGPGSASGPITVDSTTFVAGSSVMGTDGGVYSDTLPPIASTTTAAFRMTKYRAEHVNLRDIAGAALGVSGNPLFTTGNTTVQISTVQVVNSTISVTGSTVNVNVNGTVPVSISGSLPVLISSVSVSGSTVTVSNGNINVTNSGFAVTNTPTVLITSTPAFQLNGAIPAGTNQIGLVSGSTVTVANINRNVTGSTVTIVTSGGVALPVSGTLTVNPGTAAFPIISTNTLVVAPAPGQAFPIISTNTLPVSGSVSITNASIQVTLSTTNVSGSTVTIGGTPNVSVTNTPSVNIVNVATVTVSGAASVSGSSVTVTNGNVTATISGIPSVNINNTPTVSISGTPNVNVTNTALNVTGSTVGINGTVPVTFSGTQNTNIVNVATVTVSGTPNVSVTNTPNVNAIQSGNWLNTIQVLSSVGIPTSVGFSGAAAQVPSVITDGVRTASVTAVSGQTGLNVNIIGGAGAGGTSSTIGSAYPNAGTAAGFVGPTGLMQAGAVDVSSNVLVHIVEGVTGSTVNVGGIVQVAGTVAISTAVPFNVSGSTVNVNGIVTVNVNNTPNVSVTNTPNVSVTNTIAANISAPLPAGSNVIGGVTISGSPTFSASGSTVTVINPAGGTLSVSVSNTPSVNINSSIPAGTNNIGLVTGSTVTVIPTGGGNFPVAIQGTPSVNISAALPAGTNNIGTVTGSTVNVNGTVTTTITGTPSVNINNSIPAGTNNIGTVTGSTVNINGSVAVTGTIAATQSGTWNVNATPVGATPIISTNTLTISGSVSGSTVTVIPTGGGNFPVVIQTGTNAIGKINFNTPTTDTLTNAAINASSTGDNVIVSTQSAQTVRVFRMYFVVSAATTITFKSGGGTALSGAISLLANGAIVLDFDGEPWFLTTASQAFIINQTGTAQISGTIYYTQS